MDDDRNWAVGVHLTALLGGVAGGAPAFLGPLIIWLLKRDQSPFVRQHAVTALNFHISALIYALVIGIGVLLTFGLSLFLLIPLGVLWLVFTVQALSAASQGRTYAYPLALPLFS